MPKQKDDPPLEWIKPEKAMAIWIVSAVLILIASVLFICFARVPEEKVEDINFQFERVQESPLHITKDGLLPEAPHCLIQGQVYGTLIDCLIHHESGGNKWAKGKAGEKGILQFMPSTFQHYCVDMYGYRDDIWDEEIQRGCCGEMIEDGRLHHWTTDKFCYKLVK